jgi:hypothetical protein
MDIENAMEVAITKKARARLMAYYLGGYTYEEIGEREGVSDEAVRQSINGTFGAIVRWLESPKSPKCTAAYVSSETVTHGRKYSCPPEFMPAQR